MTDSPQSEDSSLLNVAGHTESFRKMKVQQKIIFFIDTNKLSVSRGVPKPRQVSNRFACVSTQELLLGFIKDEGTPN